MRETMCTSGVLLLLLLLAQQHCPCGGASQVVKMATFNIQNLGQKKVADPDVMQVLDKIFERYDVVLVQEVQDKSERAPSQLNLTINANKSRCKKFNYVLSEIVGRKTGEKEQYAIYYRPCVVTVEEWMHYSDPQDVYTRDPFLTKIKFKNSALDSVALCNLHAKPDATKTKETVKELNELANVYDFMVREFGTKNAIMLGDMNSDGSYVSNRDWDELKLRRDPRFRWLVTDGTDTTVRKSTPFTYDRVIVGGEQLIQAVKGSAKPYLFDEFLSFTPDQPAPMTEQQALKVSDHYPVEFEIRL